LGKFIDLTGQRFGRLVVVERAENKGNRVMWLCNCDCGKSKIIQGKSLTTKKTQSCGCLYKEKEIIDLTGQRFGKLVAIKHVIRPKNVKAGTYWLCKCDCGNEKAINACHLRNGNTQSCGCLQKEMVSKVCSKGYGESSFNRILRQYKKNAKARGFEFRLSNEIFKNIITQQCFYCGIEPIQIMKQKYNTGVFYYNGLDRIDSLEGYIEDNVIPCCGTCNAMKSAMGKQKFLDHIEKIHNYQKGKNNNNENS
jgi:hypothetical protein